MIGDIQEAQKAFDEAYKQFEATGLPRIPARGDMLWGWLWCWQYLARLEREGTTEALSREPWRR